MFDCGAAAGHIEYGDLSALDFASGDYSVGGWLYFDTIDGTHMVFSKWVATSAGKWEVRINAALGPYLSLLHWSSILGGGYDIVNGNTVLVVSTLYSFIITYNGTTNAVTMYLNNSPESLTGTMGGPPQANNDQVCVGADDVGTYGIKGSVGNVMAWNAILDSNDVNDFHNGIVPKEANRIFHARGTSVPGTDEVGGGFGTLVGTVTLDSQSPPDNYYLDTIYNPPRILGGEELFRSRDNLNNHVINTPLIFLSREIMDDIDIQHREGLEPTGKGFGFDNSPKRLASITEMSVEPMRKQLKLSAWDVRNYLIMFYDQLVLPKTVSSLLPGEFKVYPPNVYRTSVHGTNVLVEQLDGDYGTVIQDVEPLSRYGIACESARTNLVPNSAFASGIDVDWTSVNETGGASVTADTDDVLIDRSNQSVKIIADDPLPASLHVGHRVTTQALTVTGKHVISILHKDDLNTKLSLQVTRSSDSFYLKADGTWQAASAEIDIPVSLTETRWVSNPSDGVATHTWTITIYAKTLAGQVNHIYHCQVEAGLYATTPILTPTGSSLERTVITNQISNTSVQRTFNKEKGHLFFHAHPEFNSTSDVTENKFFLAVYHNGNNKVLIYERYPQKDIVASFTIEGSISYSIIQASDFSFDRMDELKFGLVWMAPGDMGVKNYQYQLFFDDGNGWKEGNIVETGGVFLEVDAGYIHLGGYLTNTSDVFIKYLRSSSIPFFLDEMKALP